MGEKLFMKKVHAYLIAEKLYFNASSNSLCNRNWLFSIYKSLLISNTNENEEIIWTKYNQWKIDHNCRTAKSLAKNKGITIINFDLTIVDENTALLNVTFSEGGLRSESIPYVYRRDSFLNSLWELKNAKQETILLGPHERDQLFESSIYSSDEIEVKSEAILSNKKGKKSKKGAKKESQAHTRHMKFIALNNLLNQIREIYRSTEEPNQRSFLEVVLGAAIFYLPSLNSHFNGFISVGALKGYLTGDRRVKDHIYPRKKAARELLSKKITTEELIDKYHNHLATYMYITSSENSYLINYFESHEDHDEAMRALSIEKFPTSEKEKFESHKELSKFLVTVDAKAAQKMNAKELMELLREFRKN
jgi:hypothetical protein